ncbi:response regulator [Burkholderia sp. Ac-20365]|jgi:FixJ family two-component response regulator|uniref:response regulator n=1 Tax=Burkholderia sp. Ac-20365 TaxID=2703897 RepID=UPI00197BDA01|nr:response regulator [Burkholderia sp. Ac-20365]MBN3766221.1 response regulator [Burkholderia sp. Ac-20365]
MKAKRSSAVIGVVDDDESVRMGLSSMLRAEGWNSAAYASAEQLLGDTRRSKLQLVITDIQMPGIDGFALLNAIKLWKHSIPVICITAYATEAVLARASADGAAGFFPKPVDDEQLLARIAELLDKGG